VEKETDSIRQPENWSGDPEMLLGVSGLLYQNIEERIL
jgi:hypothetical protein